MCVGGGGGVEGWGVGEGTRVNGTVVRGSSICMKHPRPELRLVKNLMLHAFCKCYCKLCVLSLPQ